MKIKRNMSCAALLAGSLAAAVFTTNTAHADNASWTGAVDGTWSNVNNWAGPPAAVPGTGNTATFDGTSTGGIIDLGAGVTVNQILFITNTSPSITLGAGAVNSQTLTLNGVDGLAGDFANSPGQTLTINAALTVTGASPRFVGIAPATVTINGSLTTAAASGTTLLRLNDGGMTLNGVLSNGPNALLGLQPQQNTYSLSNAGNTFTGGILLENATVNVGSISMTGLPSAAGAGGTIGFGNVFGFGALNYTGTATTTDRNLSITHGLNGGRITQSGTGLLKFTSDITSVGLSGSATLQLQGSTAGIGEIAGSIQDHATIGTTTNRNNVASGATTIQLYSVDGIEVGAAVSGSANIPGGTTVTAINTATRTITLSQATTGGVAQNLAIAIDGVYNPTSVAKSGTGKWDLSGANAYSGTTTVTGGFLTLSNSLALQNSSLNTAGSSAGSGTLGLQTTVTALTIGGLSGNKDLKSLFQTDVTAGGYNSVTALTLNPGTGRTLSYSGAIVDGAIGMTLTKDGAGTQTLGGTNSYTGTTTVSAGVLAVNGSLANTSTTVESGGTLQGSGTIGGSVTIQGGGTLASGNSIESLGVGDLSFLVASTFAYELQTDLYAGTPNVAGDLTFSTGTLDITAGAILTLTDLATSTALAVGSKLTLISYFGGWAGDELFTYEGDTLADGGEFTLGANQWRFDYNDTTGGPNFSADQSGATSFVTMTVIPEPGAALLGSLGLFALLLRRR